MKRGRRELRAELNRQVDARELTLVEALRKMRKVLGMSQSRYARYVGLTPRTLSDFERGAGNPTVETLRKLFAPFGFELSLVRKAGNRQGELAGLLGELVAAELCEAASVHGETPTQLLVRAVRHFVELPARVHTRSWQLGKAEAWTDAAGQLEEQGDSPLARLLRTQAEAERAAASQSPWDALGQDWPRENDLRDTSWRIFIQGVGTPPVHVPGQPAVGDFVVDAERYYVVVDRRLHPAEERQLVLEPVQDTPGIRNLRRTAPERFRRIRIRDLR